ncbi:hypothetical protein ES677_00320 [Bizionia gelidisalsuginis]|uniref:Letm1 RBD domain-containing protein n=2 Tax=Bizionia TaxID=283785 RepID=A0A8H2LEE8_9FLAO|nr:MULTISPECIES: LETM1-related biofilm-associated protein [Bizionia]TYB77464.1 hypothetical protein ES676_03990 [Bizionia saleffrena]TYC17855.1 hypothetical protein ES677_00320 [Bizionia gelidisalsuginis]
MNPSTSGWIKKFESIVRQSGLFCSDFNALYSKLRQSGFLYGLNIFAPPQFEFEHTYSKDEIGKVNLLTGLYHTYVFTTGDTNFNTFLTNVVQFYKDLEVSDLSLWDKLFIRSSDASVLERLINDRVQLDNNLLTRNFNKTVTNSLVFIDILTFRQHLKTGINVNTYAARLETILVNITYDALNYKVDNNKKDLDFLKSLRESISYVKDDSKNFNLNYRRALETDFNYYEKKYFLDIACLAIWEDVFEDDKAYNFVKSVGVDMNLSVEEINDALNHIVAFNKRHKEEFSVFKTSTPIANFYDNSSKLVMKLIKRNSKRIFKELVQSKDLMVLLTQATTRDLTKEEQKKVQSQLIDIFKTIPSLAIFILPGGAILLPIVVKLIPNMLPSTFNDNKVEKVKEEKKPKELKN